MMRLKIFTGLLLMVLFLTSCENEPYDTGDGALSHLTTVFGEADYDGEGRAYRFTTDADKQLMFTSPLGDPDPHLCDATKRMLLYYNITGDESMADPVMLVNVLTANVMDRDSLKSVPDDPVKVESVWLGENKKYLNLSLMIKTSMPDDKDLKHKLGAVYEGSEDGVASVRFLHDDGNIPGNYSVRCYFSIPVRSFATKVSECRGVSISINTYEGMRCFELDLN